MGNRFLQKLTEALNRRSFLGRSLGAATAALAPGKLARAATAAAPAIVPATTALASTGSIWELVNAAFHALPPASMPKGIGSPEQVRSELHALFQRPLADTELLNMIAATDSWDYLDNYTGGAAQQELKQLVGRVGPSKLVRDVLDWYTTEVMPGSLGAESFAVLDSLSQWSQPIAQLFPRKIVRNAIDGKPERLLRLLRRHHAVDPERLNDAVKKQAAAQRKRWQETEPSDSDLARWEGEGGRYESFTRKLNTALHLL